MAEPAVRPVGAALFLLTGQTVCSSVSRSPGGLLLGSRWGENSDGAVRGCCIGACGWQERRVKKETSIASPSCSINSCDHTCLSQNHSPLIPNGPRVTWNPVGTSSYRSDSLNSQLRTKVAMPGLEAPVLKSCCQDLNSSYYYELCDFGKITYFFFASVYANGNIVYSFYFSKSYCNDWIGESL